MRSFHLPPLPLHEEISLKEMEKHPPTPRTRQRATIVLMSSRGLDQTAIQQALGVSWPFVHRTLTRYQAIGFLSLMESHPGATVTLRPEPIEPVIHWLEQGPKAYHYSFTQWTTRSLRWRIRVVFGVQLTREAIRQLLRRLGFRWKRPATTYARVDTLARDECKKKLDTLLTDAREGKIVLLMQDEAIVSLLTSVVCGWSRVGQQLRIPSSGKPDRWCVFAVVNPLTGDVHSRIFFRINRTNMKRLIRHLRRFYGKSPIPPASLHGHGQSYGPQGGDSSLVGRCRHSSL
ncbi:IS630 family transposase [Candidatus Poribacteria bacterium]|nr:IS630 family transposase [Candidatus Poribacteria bacterium]